MHHTVVMVTTSYPRFEGDSVGTFLEPIARGVAARGHAVHVVAPWHPLVARPRDDRGVFFHFFRYAPVAGLNVFGYAHGMHADTSLRLSAYAMAPLALAAGWRAASKVARREGATVMHGHWVIPGGVIAAAAAGGRPLVVSLHGSDVYVAERNALARRAARVTLRRARWVTACSEDLRQRAVALGADASRVEVLPYGVDAERFRPDPNGRAAKRRELGLAEDSIIVFTAGRLVRKKGFEYLVDAVALLAGTRSRVTLVVAGQGDLLEELQTRADSRGIDPQVRFIGAVTQPEVATWLAAADVAVVPSVRDDAGNVDGLPNVIMEALASGTALVATSAGGIGAVLRDGETAVLVPERDPPALARAIDRLLEAPDERAAIGAAARRSAIEEHGWGRVAERFEEIYDEVNGRTSFLRGSPVGGGTM